MRIRSYKEKDEIEGLVYRAVASVDSDNYSHDQQKHLEEVIPEMNLEFAESDRFSYFVADEANQVIGVAGFNIESGTVSGIFVEPEKMGEGVGTKLLERIEREAEKEDLEKLETPASLDATEFYHKNGFEEVEEKVEDIKGKDIEQLMMEKKLK